MLWVPKESRESETPGKRAYRRAAPLTFGVFGARKKEDGQKYLEGGSGILTHAFSGLSAKHVGRYLMTLDDRGDRVPKGSFTTAHSATIFQHLNPLDEKTEAQHSLWHVERVWDSPITDISLIQVAAGSGPSHDVKGHYPWQLLPPPVDSKVYMIGFPGFSVHDFAEEEEFGIHMTLQHTPATVTKIYPLRRGTGLLDYPCFEVDRKVDPGYSGGPVIYNDALCGLVSVSSSFEDKTWCSTLWPISLLEYDSEIPGVMTKVSDLFASRVIDTVDWSDVRGRISQRKDEFGRSYAHIEE
jgi:hypothetical protein